MTMGILPRPRCPAYRRYKRWEAVVDQDGINVADEFVGVFRENTIELCAPYTVATDFSPASSSKMSETEIVAPS